VDAVLPPEELFDEDGRPVAELLAQPPRGDRRMSANPKTNGGSVLVDLRLPDFRQYGVDVPAPGRAAARADPRARRLGEGRRGRQPRLVPAVRAGRDRQQPLQDVFEVTGRRWGGLLEDGDDRLTRDGRVIEILSEHLCQGMLEGYLLTGRHGLYTSYEAFIHNNDSMFNQHAKWMQACNAIPGAGRSRR
jgi:xylulose-5-phosphate/fructose-6-phosphate phosphoketolase